MTIGVKICSLDFEVAKTTLTNKDLEKFLDTTDEWITKRTGIKKRQILKDSETSVELGINAAKKAIERASFNPLDFDLIISASSAPEEIYPSTSCVIQDAIQAKNAACFDLKAACAGLIYSLNVARAFIKSGIYKNILIVATDSTSKYTDWSDRSTCVLFSDGAGAIILKADENDDDILDIDLMADGSCKDYITLTVKGKPCPIVDEAKENKKPFIQMKGKEVYRFVMNEMPPRLEKLLKNCNLTPETIDYFLPHQSNQRMINALAEKLAIDGSKIISTIENHGNMSAASVIVALRESIDNKNLKLPAKILISTFGAGMSAGNAIIKLDENI